MLDHYKQRRRWRRIWFWRFFYENGWLVREMISLQTDTGVPLALLISWLEDKDTCVFHCIPLLCACNPFLKYWSAWSLLIRMMESSECNERKIVSQRGKRGDAAIIVSTSHHSRVKDEMRWELHPFFAADFLLFFRSSNSFMLLAWKMERIIWEIIVLFHTVN